MAMSIAVVLHALAAVCWIGSVFLAGLWLRPAADGLDRAARQRLWIASFRNFLPWVVLAVAVLLISGLYVAAATPGWTRADVLLHVALGVMLTLLVVVLTVRVYSAPFARLRRCVERADVAAAEHELASFRWLAAVAVCLGLAGLLIGALGSLNPLGT
ncbi:MAG TPA: hypothetical protein VFQ88_15380 [Nevskiaceae bacterium]|nr:hypothetical protein [Nevskiaceae bacterium]